MVSTATANPSEDLYDPDSPPEDRGFLGKLTVTAHVDGNTVTPSQGEAEDARIVKTVEQYTKNAKVNYSGPIWYLEGEGIDVVREDGQPFRQHETIKLMSAKGNPLGGKQTPDLIAQAYRALGVTASYTKTGEPNTAVGRVFQFGSHTFKLGPKFEKSIRMFPREIMPESFIFEGEPRVIPTRKDEDDEGFADVSANTSTLSEAEIVERIREVFAGHTAEDLMNIVIDDEVLNKVVNVFGVGLLEGATDESIVSVLQEHRVMALDGAGLLQPI